jgi:hypothetical protein
MTLATENVSHSSMRMPCRQPKVFCVGFQKTGTSSMGRALGILGFKVRGWLAINNERKAKRYVAIDEPITMDKLAQNCIPLLEGYDAAQDTHWYLLYRELDDAFPGSKFILTRREPEAWFGSFRRHFGENGFGMMHFIYGESAITESNRDSFIRRYMTHNKSVEHYFRNRRDDLLVLDIETAGWDKLCGFLNRRKPPFRPFPHANSYAIRRIKRFLK